MTGGLCKLSHTHTHTLTHTHTHTHTHTLSLSLSLRAIQLEKMFVRRERFSRTTQRHWRRQQGGQTQGASWFQAAGAWYEEGVAQPLHEMGKAAILTTSTLGCLQNSGVITWSRFMEFCAPSNAQGHFRTNHTFTVTHIPNRNAGHQHTRSKRKSSIYM